MDRANWLADLLLARRIKEVNKLYIFNIIIIYIMSDYKEDKKDIVVEKSITNKPPNTSVLKNQDLIQKFSIVPVVVFELYKVMVSSFLILFVPQKCGDHVCQLNENLVLDNELYNAGLVLNFITMFSFIIFYFYEIKRENRLIAYLEVNQRIPFDNTSVGKVLELLPIEKRTIILSLDKRYQQIGYFVLFMFLLNSIVSGFVVYEYYLDNQTTTTFITNILFMITKLSDIYATVHTEENIFYSAYLKGKIQYNDVDPDKLLKIEDKKTDIEIPVLTSQEIIIENKESHSL
jgi:hypothetical protein